MTIRLLACAIIGVDAQPVTIEIDVARGQPHFIIVGLPDTAIKEASERIRSAIRNSGFGFPYDKRVIINLAPADIRKEGPSYDVAMALGILMASSVAGECRSDVFCLGELSLDGRIRAINGILPRVMFAKQSGFSCVCVPKENAYEAALICDIDVMPVDTLKELVDFLRGRSCINSFIRDHVYKRQTYPVDMSDIRGQFQAKRALEIAAAGGHNVLLSGPPGTGKTLLARSMPSILPSMSESEILEVTKLYSISGLLSTQKQLIDTRPFRSPHQSGSVASIIGGGGIPRPGELSLAHRGVLFLDELPEFSRFVLEALRQPLEDGCISVSRVRATYEFPARFILIASQNPCPCGYLGDVHHACVCSSMQVARYSKKISGPLRDRIDLFVHVGRLDNSEMNNSICGETSDIIRARVENARSIQVERFKDTNTNINAEMSTRQIREVSLLTESAEIFLRKALEKLHLSMRSYSRVIKVARTIADLEAHGTIEIRHIAESLQYKDVNNQ